MAENSQSDKKRISIFALLGLGLLVGFIMAGLTLLAGGRSTTGQGISILPTPIPDPIREGQLAPNFTAQTPDGDTISLEDYRGNIVAVNFWATWCAPCRVEMPALQAAADAYSGQLVILAVNAGETAGTVQEFMEELGLTFPALLDPGQDIVELYGVRAFPTTVWIDAKGIVQAEHLGPLTEGQINQYIQQLMTE